MADAKAVGGLLVVVVGGALLILLLTALPAPAIDEAESPWVGPWLWEVRGLDMAIQSLLILAGVLGVLLILRRKGEGT